MDINNTGGDAKMKSQAAKAAAQIRKTLKSHGIQATVRSDNYSMGSSIDVALVDATPSTLKKVEAFCERYEYGTFDGMTDCSGFKNQDFDGPQAKHVSVTNTVTQGLLEKFFDHIRATDAFLSSMGGDYSYLRNTEVTTGFQYHAVETYLKSEIYDMQDQRVIDFWRSVKPRVKGGEEISNKKQAKKEPSKSKQVNQLAAGDVIDPPAGEKVWLWQDGVKRRYEIIRVEQGKHTKKGRHLKIVALVESPYGDREKTQICCQMLESKTVKTYAA